MISYKEFEGYISNHPPERKTAFMEIISQFSTHLPAGFAPEIAYKMPSFVVPHSLYPAGYHCDPKQALPFVSFANQKNFIAVYHMGIYAKPELLEWFKNEYPNHSKGKLDMGKSCIRFKKMDDIPYELLAALAAKMTVEDWIQLYEANYKKTP
jgi:uncharacterized protein YdhG (YjbR/CyaY superfamily)